MGSLFCLLCCSYFSKNPLSAELTLSVVLAVQDSEIAACVAVYPAAVAPASLVAPGVVAGGDWLIPPLSHRNDWHSLSLQLFDSAVYFDSSSSYLATLIPTPPSSVVWTKEF